MQIGGVSASQNQQVNLSQQTDAVSRNIQEQIARAQKQMQELSSNDTLTVEEKMKRRQEIQKQISELNNQLRQHQIDVRKEEQEKKQASKETGVQKTEKDTQDTGMSQAGMQSFVKAESALKQAKTQGSVATEMEGQANVLASEIKMDKQRGNSVEKKEDALAELQQNTQNVKTAQLNTLAEASENLTEQNQRDATSTKTAEHTEIEGSETKHHMLEKTDVKMYSDEGKPVEEETDPVISVLV